MAAKASSVRALVEHLHAGEEQHLKLLGEILLADGGRLFGVDLVVCAVLQRSLCLISGFCMLIEQRNLLCAAPLLRLQVDSLIRLYACWLVKDPHSIATHLLQDRPLNKVKSRDNQLLTDKYLWTKAAEHYPWVGDVYKATSGFIHLLLLQRRLAQARASGARALAIEASSIGLDQGRLNGLHVDIALFTNFTRDHLDYHGDMQAYEAAKRRLFDWPGLRHAVINLDDDMGQRLVAHLRSRPEVGVIGYSLTGADAGADADAGAVPVLRASEIRSSQGGTVFQMSTPQGATQVRTQLVGQFNVSNVLGIAGVLLARGVTLRAVVELLEGLQPVPGRMQQLGGAEAPLVVIDYAHTPDALTKTLATLREVARQRHGRMWCVFGCGGDRDPGKRPQMGAAATAADHVIVTSDNPRGENPADIIEQIIEGMKISNAMHSAPHVIEDRAAAILYAVKHASRADVVLLAGKGHETYQEIKGRKLPFQDADHAALSLAARVTMKGML